MNKPTKCPPAECLLCQTLPERSYADLEQHEALPKEAEQLGCIGGYDNRYSELQKCPFCGTYYRYSHDRESSPCGPSHNTEMLVRISAKQALDLIREFLKDNPSDTLLLQELRLLYFP